MQMSGHIHNLMLRPQGKRFYTHMKQGKTQSQLNGTEKGKISAFALIIIHFPCLGLRQYFKYIGLPGSSGDEDK